MQLYIHVPFCVKKCHYCAFYSIPASSLNILENFKPSLTLIDKSENIYDGIEAVQSVSRPKTEQTVQSLSSFLTAKSMQKNIAFDNTQETAQGTIHAQPNFTLADAFLSKEQADRLRSQLGMADFSPQKIPAPKKQRLKLPKEFCHKFKEEHPLKQSTEFQLWKSALLKELGIIAQYYGTKPVTSIFFGGGTPSFIPLKDIEDIMQFIIGRFSVQADCEISLEANPDSINNIKAVAYKKMGFNRVSLGVQSLNNEYLQLMGRPHTALQAQQAYHALRSAGFANISLDFIWGLPTQRLKTWLDDLKKAIKLAPEHISAYGLSIEEGSYFDLLDKEGKLQMACEQEQAQMYKTGSALLEEAGYMQYEISNYAKMGMQCRHNLGYWLGSDYMGAGPAAASTMGNIRRTHSSSLEEWALDISTCFAKDIEAQAENRLQPHKSTASYVTEYLTPVERLCELVMLRMRTVRGLKLSEYEAMAHKNFVREHQKLIQLLDKNNLLRIKNGHASFTRNGMLVSNSILEHFFKTIRENHGKTALE